MIAFPMVAAAPAFVLRSRRPTMQSPAPHNPAEEAADLLRRIAGEDEDALAELYDRFAPTLMGVVRSVLRDRTESEDVLQEVFVTIWNRAGAYDPALGRPQSWLITVARNRAYDRARSLGRKAELRKERETELADTVAERLRRQWDPSLRDDEVEAITRALDKLSDEQREAVAMAYLNGFTQQEIAETLDSPIGTVKARIRRGLGRLHELLRHTSLRDQP